MAKIISTCPMSNVLIVLTLEIPSGYLVHIEV